MLCFHRKLRGKRRRERRKSRSRKGSKCPGKTPILMAAGAPVTSPKYRPGKREVRLQPPTPKTASAWLSSLLPRRHLASTSGNARAPKGSAGKCTGEAQARSSHTPTGQKPPGPEPVFRTVGMIPEGVHRSWRYCNTRSMRGVDGASSYSIS